MTTEDKKLATESKAPRTREHSFVEEMDRAFDRLMSRGLLPSFRSLWPDWAPFQPDLNIRVPRVDMVDRDTEVLIRAEVPGLRKEELHLELSGDLLTIHGERKREETQEGERVYRSEIFRGAFDRSIPMPTGIDKDAVEATVEDGMLEIHLPKLEAVERRTIEVS
jgi:HSP20 family protein